MLYIAESPASPDPEPEPLFTVLQPTPEPLFTVVYPTPEPPTVTVLQPTPEPPTVLQPTPEPPTVLQPTLEPPTVLQPTPELEPELTMATPLLMTVLDNPLGSLPAAEALPQATTTNSPLVPENGKYFSN